MFLGVLRVFWRFLRKAKCVFGCFKGVLGVFKDG